MYIEPNSTVKLIKNCPIDKDYNDTIYFDNIQSQVNYFLNLDGLTLNKLQYQRIANGVFRCSLPMASSYDVNYMMFKNTAFENFWFYAFVDRIEYINNGLCYVYFTIDEIQTWFFGKQLELEECMVEREHSRTDAIGDNIEAENIALGEYKFNEYTSILPKDHDQTDRQLNTMCYVLAVTDVDGKSEGNVFDGIYSGTSLYVYSKADVQALTDKINEYVEAGKPDAINGIYCAPLALFFDITGQGHKVDASANGKIFTATLPRCNIGDGLDGYVPRNHKLYTYPYNFLHVDNSVGNELDLRYEFFEGRTPRFRIEGTVTEPIALSLKPYNYKGSGNANLQSEVLTINNYPMCSWNYDAYQAWVAQEKVPYAVKFIGLLGAGAGSALTGHIGGVVGSAAGIASLFTNAYSASIKADVSAGNFNNGGTNAAHGELQFYYGRCSINAQNARIIDEYFTMFGYATKRVKIPNIAVRPHFTYTKTIDCKLHGSAPADDIQAIQKIFDKGIRFWRNGSEIGNYSVDNSPQ